MDEDWSQISTEEEEEVDKKQIRPVWLKLFT